MVTPSVASGRTCHAAGGNQCLPALQTLTRADSASLLGRPPSPAVHFYRATRMRSAYRGVASLLSTSCNNIYLCVSMAFWPPYWEFRDDRIMLWISTLHCLNSQFCCANDVLSTKPQSVTNDQKIM